MPIKPQSAKAKGRLLQQWVRDKIIALWPALSGHVLSRSMGANGTDIILSPTALKKFPYAVECKNRAKISVYEWYDQSCLNAEGQEPLVVLKANRKKPLVLVDAEHFFDMVKKCH